MATVFSGTDDQCDGPGCSAASGVNYYVQERKSFCNECATKIGCKLGLICERHGEPVRLHCKHHDLAVCHLCEATKHRGPSCDLQDVEDAIAFKQNKLKNLQKTSKDKVSSWKNFKERLSKCGVDAEIHLKLVEKRVHSVIDDEISRINTKEQNEKLKINQEADAEIKEIDEKRNAHLYKCHENAKKNRQPIESRRRELLNEVTAIADKIQTKIEGLQCDAKELIQAIDKEAKRIAIFLEDDKKLLEGANEVVTSLTHTLGKTADESVEGQIARTVKGVRFIEGVRNEKYNGRIGGYEGKWELHSTVEIPGNIKTPRNVGCTGNEEVIMLDVSDGERHTYCINVRNKTSQRVISSGSNKTCIVSCALLNDDTIVCGKYMEGCTGKSLSGCISMYDRSWQLIRDITIPKSTPRSDTSVYVAVDRDGMIVAAVLHLAYIYIINPSDGSIVKTITCTEYLGKLRGVLSTGDFIALTSPSLSESILAIDRMGAQREITHREVIENCCIDPLADDLYVVYEDEERGMAVIDQLSGEGHLENVDVISFHHKDSPTSLYLGRPVMTTSGEIIVCNGRDCLVFKKNVIV